MLRQPIHKLLLLSACCLLLTAMTYNVQAKPEAGRKNGAGARTFELTALFGLYPKTEIKTEINVDAPFTGQTHDKEGHAYYIGGVLSSRKKGKYLLVLTYVAWDFGEERVTTEKLEIEPNKTYGPVCSSDGVIHGCLAVTLSPVEK